MREVTYYRAISFLPIVFPALLIAADLFLSHTTGIYLQAGRVGTLLVGSLGVGGLPYLLFVLAALFFLRDKPANKYRRAILVAPLVFVPFLGLIVFSISLSSSNLSLSQEFRGLPSGFGYLALLVLPLGYSYVAVALLGASVFFKIGLIERE